MAGGLRSIAYQTFKSGWQATFYSSTQHPHSIYLEASIRGCSVSSSDPLEQVWGWLNYRSWSNMFIWEVQKVILGTPNWGA